MLILSRNIGDSIRIGDNIKLTILENDGQVRSGWALMRRVKYQCIGRRFTRRYRHRVRMTGIDKTTDTTWLVRVFSQHN